MRRSIWAGLGILGAAGITWMILQVAHQDSPPISSSQSIPSSAVSPLSQKETVKVKKAPVAKKEQSPKQTWQSFQSKFGSELKAEFLPDGRLVAIHGQYGKGSPGTSKFRPEDSAQAIARAQEILSAATEMLQIQSDWPLGKVVAQGTPLSAQVYLNETFKGLPVAPVGAVKVILGPKGELVALYSDYAPQLNVVNEARLNLDQARMKALEVTKGLSPLGVNAAQVIWVNEEKQGRFAYDFRVQGHQVLIDAQTGGVLYSRDRRHY